MVVYILRPFWGEGSGSGSNLVEGNRRVSFGGGGVESICAMGSTRW